MEHKEATQILIFTDCIAAARLAIDPSAHSGQGHSLDVCRNLLAWFQQEGEHTVTFIQVPSIKEWGIHKGAHDFVGGLPPISVGRHPQNSLDRVRQDITSKCLDSWITQFQRPEYAGHHFLHLNDLKGKPLQPTYLNGGTWLKSVDASHSLTARFARCVLNHAPIGAYYQRFNMDEPTACVCGTALETRTHVLNQCPRYKRKGPVRRVFDLAKFLQANPLAFAFKPSQEGIG